MITIVKDDSKLVELLKNPNISTAFLDKDEMPESDSLTSSKVGLSGGNTYAYTHGGNTYAYTRTVLTPN